MRISKAFARAILLSLPLVCCAEGDGTREEVSPPHVRPFPASFMWGISTDVSLHDQFPWREEPVEERLDLLTADLLELGAGWLLAHVIWNEITPCIEPVEQDIADISDAMIEEYATAAWRWSTYDLLVERMDTARIGLILGIGGSFTRMLPSVGCNGTPSLPATPDNLGASTYLAQLYLHTRAAVRRYNDRVHIWLLDTELNFDWGHLFFSGWRQGALWLDQDFTLKVIEVLNQAVKDEDPAAFTVTQILTDDPRWREWLLSAEQYLDVLGLSGYPNYFCGWPVVGENLGGRVREALELGTGKPVLILMSGYPTPSTVPLCEGTFTSERQGEWIEQAARAVYQSGARGFFYFTLSDQDYLGHPTHLVTALECCFGLVASGDQRKHGWDSYCSAIQEYGKGSVRQFSH